MSNIGDGKKILYIEDDPKTLQETVERLQAMGFKVKTFTHHDDVDHAIDSIPKMDLILTDNNTYREGKTNRKQAVFWLDGFRQDPDNANKHTPAILVTATGRLPTRIAQALEAGFSGFIHKQEDHELEKWEDIFTRTLAEGSHKPRLTVSKNTKQAVTDAVDNLLKDTE
jgi:CheY-like chemotaxis protein